VKRLSNAERATSNSERKRHFEIGCSALRVRRLLSSVRRSTSLLLERMLGDVPPTRRPASFPKKCYNFQLAMAIRFTAYCICHRTATLLLVVD
jgi:hypothetical protein